MCTCTPSPVPMSEDERDMIENEIALVSTIYEDAITRDDPAVEPFGIVIQLPFSFELHIIFSRFGGYPAAEPPEFTVTKAPNAVLLGEYQAAFKEMVKENVEMEQGNVLPLVVPMAMELATSFGESNQASIALAAQAYECEQQRWEEEQLHINELSKPFYQSSPILDRKSKFIAHLTPVSSDSDVHEAIAFIRSQRAISTAHHKSIYAYRYRDATTGRIVADLDDDGESGASTRMMFILEQLNVEGWLVIVTRWFGGTLLGPDRFKHIMSVTREVLESCPEVKRAPKK